VSEYDCTHVFWHSEELARTAFLFRFGSQDDVLLDTIEEDLTSLGVLYVLYAKVDTFPDVAVSDTLVDQNTDGSRGDIVDNTRAAA